MRIELPSSIQQGGARGLVAVPPRVVAPKSDAHRQSVTLNDWTHLMPHGWTIADGRSGDVELVFAVSPDEKQTIVLAGTATGIVQILGYKRELIEQIRRTRFGIGLSEGDGVVGKARAAAALGELS